ncbi:MAG: hypothetical protein ACI8X5_000926 [Planctomycetota bacterium]|jgi:hypothetical protein
MRTKALISILALPFLLPSCAAVLGVGAGVAISQDMSDSNAWTAQLPEDIDIAWATAKASLGKQSLIPIRIDDDRRAAVASIDGAEVTMTVEAFDINRCRLRISARKYGVVSSEIAELVFNRILNNFED